MPKCRKLQKEAQNINVPSWKSKEYPIHVYFIESLRLEKMHSSSGQGDPGWVKEHSYDWASFSSSLQ